MNPSKATISSIVSMMGDWKKVSDEPNRRANDGHFDLRKINTDERFHKRGRVNVIERMK